jgi:hypothetical protein
MVAAFPACTVLDIDRRLNLRPPHLAASLFLCRLYERCLLLAGAYERGEANVRTDRLKRRESRCLKSGL